MMMPRPPPWGHHEGPPRHFFNDHHPVDIYAGPEAFMEVGTRGFLVCTLAGKEEFGVDDAIDLLRQATIKLYGGIKPTFKKVPAKKGYVKIDFMDPEAIMILPTPEGEETEEEKVEEPAKPEDTEKEKEGEEKSEETKAEDSEEKPGDTEKMEEGEGNEEKQEEEKEEDSDSKSKEAADKTDKTSDNKEETETAEKDETKEEESKKEVQKEEEKKEVPQMRTPYKFKAFRTEIRNNFFIKSNVPDPVKVAETAMEIIIERKSIAGDAVSQLLPVLGVCKHDYHQLEVMTRRVLAPILDETLEPKGFSVLLIDKLYEPGSEMLIEAVRNAVWSVNPQAWQSSPLTEPDIVIRVELLGSKLVLCCLTNFMRYRHYSPKLIVQMGVGEAEDDDGTYFSVEERRRQAALREQREKQRELERQREEERRKEREKRRAEAEARRAEAEAKRRAEAEARRKEREKNREKKKREEEEEKKKKEKSREEEGDKDDKKEKEGDEEKADDETKAEGEEEKVEEQVGEEDDAEEKATEKRGVGRRRRSQNAASPPKKKAKVETSEAEAEGEPDEEENEEEMEESEEVEEEEGKGKKKKGKTTRGKKAGRRKTKK